MCFGSSKKPKWEQDLETAKRLIGWEVDDRGYYCKYLWGSRTWIQSYRKAESIGDAILQRQHRLRKLKSKILQQNEAETEESKVLNATENYSAATSSSSLDGNWKAWDGDGSHSKSNPLIPDGPSDVSKSHLESQAEELSGCMNMMRKLLDNDKVDPKTQVPELDKEITSL